MIILEGAIPLKKTVLEGAVAPSASFPAHPPPVALFVPDIRMSEACVVRTGDMITIGFVTTTCMFS